MDERRKVVRVFLGSPGDLEEERRAAKVVVDEINDVLASRLGYHVELVRWESVVAGFGRPQGIINRELERCELFIGMLWARWGTPPSKDGPYTSGFHEEFSVSSESCAKTGKPEISLYFKDVEPAQLADPGVELKKVLAFKQEIIDGKTVMFERFVGVDDIAGKLRRCLTQYLMNLKDQEQKSAAEETQTLPTDKDDRANLPATTATTEDIPISSEGASFLRGLVSRMEEGGDGAVGVLDVARFRLLSGMVYRLGNDERSLGVHDANLLYVERDTIDWGRAEVRGLIQAGCEHFASENAPLWCWLQRFDAFERNILPIFSLFGASEAIRGALKAMRMLGEPLNVDRSLTRETYHRNWFGSDSPTNVRVAALEYLGDHGTTADLPAIRAELDRKNYQTSGEAATAIIKIERRQGRDTAAKAVIELQPETVSDALAEDIFATGAADESVLIDALSHKSATIRRVSLRQLAAKGKLPVDTAEQLLNDPDALVRLESLVSLRKAGIAYTLSKSRGLLVRPRGGGGLAGLFAFPGASDSAGEKAYEEFKRYYWSSLKDAELSTEAAAGLIGDPEAYFESIERQFEKRGAELRKAIGDKYVAAFATELSELAARLGDRGTAMVDSIRSREAAIRSDALRSALSILCRKGNASDLPLVRAALKSGEVKYSDDDVTYLGKWGEWQDIAIIIEAANQTDGINVLAIPDAGKQRSAARAVYRLGQKRFSELLDLNMPTGILEHLIRQAADRTFKTLPDAQLDKLLRHSSVHVRKSTALKCIRHLPRRRLDKLLATQLSADLTRYYNVSFWLDFGLSAPRDRMLIAAQKELARMDEAKW